jgi:hypothetical protein
MRKTFYELLESQNFNVAREYRTLMSLFAEECVHFNYYYVPVCTYVNSTYFRELPFRCGFTCLEDLMHGIGLPDESNQLDDLYLLCEFLIAVLPTDKIGIDKGLRMQVNTIQKNITYVLEKTNHELKKDKNGNMIVVAKKQPAVLAAEIVENESVSFDIIEYNHYSLKGNLSEKKKILVSIGNYIEPILKDRTLQGTPYKSLISDTGFLLNNFHIRHNNISGAKAQEYTQALSDTEVEKWYDRAYDMALAVIITTACVPVQNELTELKNTYKWKS